MTAANPLKTRLDLRECKLPRFVGDREMAFVMKRGSLEKLTELSLTHALISQRRLFGQCYALIDPAYFRSMPYRSGVFVRPVVTTSRLRPDAERPGDIDLLVIPYEDEELLLDRSVAIEIKAVRASFNRQGKSPNDFGFSQACNLLALGFPFVVVAHLIVSEPGPPKSWLRRSVCQLLDRHDRVGEFSDVTCDWLPATLVDRCYGRQIRSCPVAEIGLLSAYIEKQNLGDPASGYWLPSGRAAQINPNRDPVLVEKIGAYFKANSTQFHEIPRFPWRTVAESELFGSDSPEPVSSEGIEALAEVRKIGL